jgi:hypothetical protein
MNSTQITNRIGHTEDLLTSFGGSMDGWEFTGEVADTGPGSRAKCGCGHAIRYAYVWKHEDGRTNVTGSVCVENAPFISAPQIERLKAALDALKAKQKAARKAAKLAAETTEVKAKVEELTVLIDSSHSGQIVKRFENVTGWVEYDVFGARRAVRDARREVRAALNLKTPKGQLNRLKKLETYLARWMGA